MSNQQKRGQEQEKQENHLLGGCVETFVCGCGCGFDCGCGGTIGSTTGGLSTTFWGPETGFSGATLTE